MQLQVLDVITPSYSKESAWMKHIEYSNSLYARVTKLITNYTLIDKYHCCFFSCKENTCYMFWDECISV